ncbi:MAG: hypothetical protein KBG82_02865 [Spirochaetes bacterium]|nr:hypothetical protein [Spirochaetota bacterium]MBP8990901.1 hypothetical protein [Spirochaetota bacterium]HOV46115.1 hypothetical protein [Exilispira sp.]HPO60863.1 hypothetical protein [Exilispira sp.]HQM89520.1 hypothetical protein [Exilispira sp.]
MKFCNRKNFYIFYILLFIIAGMLVFLFNFFSVKSSGQIYCVRDFCSWQDSFLPAATFSVNDNIFPSFFDGELIYHYKKISPYQLDFLFKSLAIYKSKDRLIGFSNYLYPEDFLKKNDAIELSEKNTQVFIIENKVFLNPINEIKPFLNTSVSIVNFYYLNEEEVPVAFRTSYKSNVIPILIYAYSTYLSGRYAFTTNVYKLEIYLDKTMVYQRELDVLSKARMVELITTSSRPQFIKYIISNVSNGEHTLTVKVYDIQGHSKEIQKKFVVKTDLDQ